MTYLRTNLSQLMLGDLLLTGTTTDAGNTFTIDALDEDATWGNPVPVDVAVQRWMTDGAVASTQGHENREVYFKVKVSAATSAALAAGEAALVKRSGKPTALAWTPPEGDPAAATTVFEVWTWHLEHVLDSTDERHLARMYGVRMTAKPWVRSEALTVSPAPAVPGAPTTVAIDAGTSTTGWTGSPNAPTTSGGAIKESFTFTAPGGGVVLSLTRTGSVTGMGTTPYLMIDATTTGGTFQFFTVSIDGTSIPKVAQIGTVSYWQVPAGVTSFTTLKVAASIAVPRGGPVLLVLSVADVSRTDTIGGVGSRKQLTRSLTVGGSVPTSGSIRVASPSATTLGNCLVYTCPDADSGYTPPMRQYRFTGNTVTADATCVSGSREAFISAGAAVGTVTYSIPPAFMPPEAHYVAVGRFIFGGAATITTSILSGSSSATGKVTATGAGAAWGILGALSLPGRTYPTEASTSIPVLLSGTANTGTHTLDELFLFDVTRGAFSLVLNLAVTNLWLDAPDVDPVRNRPAIYAGSQSDRTDAVTPDPLNILAVGDHDLDPDGAMMFTVTDGVDNAAATGTFYHRWHTHAGD